MTLNTLQVNLSLFFVAFILLISTVFAQQEENSIWYFGNSNTGIHFDAANSYAPVAIGGKYTPYGSEGGIVVTNGNGNLVFYTDGVRLLNRQHTVMGGGTNLGSCGLVAQAAGVCEVPGQAGRYYLFVNAGGGCNPVGSKNILVYIVDMALGPIGTDGFPLGLVTPFTANNNILRSDASESMLLIPKPCSNDFWLVGKVIGQSQMYSYLIDENFTINSAANLQSPAGLTNLYSCNIKYGFGKLICTATSITGSVYQMDFNDNTGVISNHLVLDNNIPYAFDVEFSPDGTKLYYSSWQQMILRQYDYNTTNITTIWSAATATQNGGGLKLAPDGKMYYLADNQTQALSVISTPNAPAAGNACGFAYNPISFGTGRWQGLTLPITVYPSKNVACTVIGAGGTISGNYTPNRVYCINNNVSVTGITSLVNSEVLVAYDVKVTVPGTSDLLIDNTHIYAESCMWKGIEVNVGGKLTIQSSLTGEESLIEDAIIAVRYNGSTTGNNNLSVSRTTFNRNNTAILIFNLKPNIANYPVSITNSIFTCRDIPFVRGSLTWPNKTSIGAAYNPSANALENQFIDESLYSSSNAAAFLKFPFTNRKPQQGINLINTGLSTLTGSSYNYRDVVIGENTSSNLFDNLNTGILCQHSNANSRNNVFQNSVIEGTRIPVPGSGIKAVSLNNSAANKNRLIAGETATSKNTFINCHIGIETSNYYEVYLKFNELRSTQVETTQNPTPVHHGKEGIVVKGNHFGKIEVLSNTLTNIEQGIQLLSSFGNLNTATGNFTNTQLIGQVSINSNTIQAQTAGATLTNQYVKHAIRVDNVLGTATPLPNDVFSDIKIERNNIRMINRGISIANWKDKTMSISKNTISLRSSLVPNDNYFGVDASNNTASQSTYHKYILENTVTGFAGYLTTLTLKGINVSSSNHTLVRCNNVSSTYNGLVLNGNSFNAQFKLNKMQNHQHGFVLDNNAISGNLGSATGPADNEYNGTWPLGTFKTGTFNGSTSQNNKMYVHNLAQYNPNGFGTTNSTTPIVDVYSLPNGSIIYSTSPVYTCTQSINAGGNNGLGLADEEKEHFRRVINHEVVFGLHPSESEHLAHQQIYTVLALNPALMENEAVLQAFYQEHQTDNLHRIHAVERHLQNGEQNPAEAVNQQINSAMPALPDGQAGGGHENAIDANYQDFFNVYIHAMQDTISPTDSLTLYQLSTACPFTDGLAVYHARALYQSLYRTGEVFGDVCPQNKSIATFQNTVAESVSLTGLKVFPNPSNESTTILTNWDNSLLLYHLTDLQGKKIEVSVIRKSDYEMQLDVSRLRKSIYLLTITNTENNESEVFKLLVQP